MARERTKIVQGDTVELVRDDDLYFAGIEPCPLPAGSRGVVKSVDEMHTATVCWDTGLYTLCHPTDLLRRV